MRFSDFALRDDILRAVQDAGYETPTPIQEAAIPVILTGRDLLGIAQTGTGKTAAFVLPMIERLASGKAKARMPRSLIISPTRELATQTAQYFETYGKHVRLSMALLIGGVGMEDQTRRLDRGVDVLIATPGRLLDQFERGNVLLGGVSILVIDEADRMLDMGFIPDVERIAGLLTRREQTLMFSATMPAEVRRLANTFLRDPAELQAAPPATTAERVDDHLAVVPPRQKFKALRHLIESHEVGKAIIFCNRKREVASLRRQMERAGMNVRDIHGDLDQSQRTKALDAFKRGEIDFLVATDVAARGLDIRMLPCVINYDVPTHADDYVHRIGRTGRAGQEGRAYTLVLPEEGRFVDAIAKLTGKAIPHLEIPGFEQPELIDGERGGRRRGRKPRAAAGEASSARAASDEAAAAKAAAVADTGAETDTETKAEPRRGERPRRRRRRAGGAEAAASETQATRAAVPADQAAGAGQDRDASEPPDRPGGASTRAHAARRPDAPVDAKPKADRKRQEPPAPVVGMGDHVPLFMQRPVPVAPLRKAGEVEA